MFLGILLLLLGILMLLERMDLIRGDFWDFAWPAIIIAIGFSLVFKHRKKEIPGYREPHQ